MKTKSFKTNEVNQKWLLIDAENKTLGRLSSKVSSILMGKNKPQYNPHQDNGDFVIVTNIEKLKFTGKKFENKKYYKHTGYPGGIKSINPKNLTEKNKSQDILKFAVKRMLPGGPLAKKQLSKLKMYYGDKHPHETQNPVEINFSTINKKNHIKV